MENATKAILIAGGLLTSMIIISMFYFIFGNMSQMMSDTSENTEQKELIAFNSKFEAYNKKLMYGIDIVSVINMAIDNNIQYGLSQNYNENVDKDLVDYYVNVVVVYNGERLSLKENYAKIKTDILDILKIPATERLKRSTKPANSNPVYDQKCDNFVNLLQQKDYKCSKIIYTAKADIIRNVGAIGRVREMVFEPRS